jgi:cell division protein FtsB
VSHIFFGNRSVWKIFELNHQINVAKQELIILSNKKNYTLSEIELLRDDNLDPDMISEIVQNSLGLIHSDQIVIEITK